MRSLRGDLVITCLGFDFVAGEGFVYVDVVGFSVYFEFVLLGVFGRDIYVIVYFLFVGGDLVERVYMVVRRRSCEKECEDLGSTGIF